jgi:predicted metalloprotease
VQHDGNGERAVAARDVQVGGLGRMVVAVAVTLGAPQGRQGYADSQDVLVMGDRALHGRRTLWVAVAAALLGFAVALAVVAMTGSDDDDRSGYDHPFHSAPGLVEPGTATEAGSLGAPGFDDPSIEEFLPFIVQDVQGFWEQQFQRADLPYRHVRVSVVSGSADGRCDTASPCVRDRRLYLPVGFFQKLVDEFRGSGDFALAYVVARELARHVQTLTGVTTQLDRAQLALQADCFAGAWAYSAYEQGLVERGVVDEGLRAAAAVGDDHVDHAQHRKWFLRGFESGDPAACDTRLSGHR